MANESKLSLKEMIRNRKTKKRLFEATLVLVYLLSLFIYQDYWIKLINFLWVDPIAGRFNAVGSWLITYYLLVVIIFMYYVIAFRNERGFSLIRIILVFIIVSLSVMYFFNFEIDFYGLTIIGELFILELIVCLKICVIKIKNKDVNANVNGLDFEHPISRTKKQILEGKETYGRTDYVITTHSLLKNTFDSKAAFAVGISGKWGSGKTSFTNDLKTLLNDDVDIVMEFKPWFCKSPNEVIEDFFNEYRYNISTFIPSLNSKLKFYMDTLQNVEFHNSAMRVSLRNFIPQKSSERIYGEIMDTLKKSTVKVVIIIDDLDRLDKDEILEVLRLIRNTANFPYTQFIVTYDKDYILKVLPQNAKVNYNDFLMKIFNLEIALPSFENIVLCKKLEEKLIQILVDNDVRVDNKKIHESIFATTNNIDYKLSIDDNEGENHEEIQIDGVDLTIESQSVVEELQIPRVLTSMRDVIRFANSFRLNISSYKTNAISDIDIVDFFHLELLRYKFTDIFYTLRDNPFAFLYLNQSMHYQIDFPYSNPNNTEIKFDSEIKFYLQDKNKEEREIVFYLLSQMFDSKKAHQFNSISNLSSYFTYFACRLDSKNISLSEVVALLSLDHESALHQLESWCSDSMNDKYKGQIKEKLNVCLERTIPVGLNSNGEIDYKKLYELIKYIDINLVSGYLEEEVRSSVIYHLWNGLHSKNNFDKISIEHHLELVKFWLCFFEIVEDTQQEVNTNMLKFVFENRKGITDQVIDILSTDLNAFKLSNRIYDYLNDYSNNKKSRTVPDPNSIDSILIIQFNRLKYYFNYVQNIDKQMLSLYDNAHSSSRLLNNKKLMSEIKNYFIDLIEKHPLSFIDSNIKVEIGDIIFEIPLKNIYGEKDLIRFGKIINDTKYDNDEKVNRVRNFWILVSNNNFESLAFRNYDIYKSITSDYDFESDVEDILKLKEIKRKLLEIDNFYEKTDIDFSEKLIAKKERLDKEKKALDREFRDIKLKFTTSIYYEIKENLDK